VWLKKQFVKLLHTVLLYNKSSLPSCLVTLDTTVKRTVQNVLSRLSSKATILISASTGERNS